MMVYNQWALGTGYNMKSTLCFGPNGAQCPVDQNIFHCKGPDGTFWPYPQLSIRCKNEIDAVFLAGSTLQHTILPRK